MAKVIELISSRVGNFFHCTKHLISPLDEVMRGEVGLDKRDRRPS